MADVKIIKLLYYKTVLIENLLVDELFIIRYGSKNIILTSNLIYNQSN
jgi:hypothetical protein